MITLAHEINNPQSFGLENSLLVNIFIELNQFQLLLLLMVPFACLLSTITDTLPLSYLLFLIVLRYQQNPGPAPSFTLIYEFNLLPIYDIDLDKLHVNTCYFFQDNENLTKINHYFVSFIIPSRAKLNHLRYLSIFSPNAENKDQKNSTYERFSRSTNAFHAVIAFLYSTTSV